MACVVGCGPRSHKPQPIDFSSNVAPPFGMEVLKGGESTEAAQHSLPKLVATDAETLVFSDAPSGVVAKVMIDQARLADVVITIASCDGVESQLDRVWAQFHRAAHVWSDPSTGWAADFVGKANGCELRFTHAGFFGATPTAFGAPASVKIGGSRQEAQKVAPAIANGQDRSASHAITDAKEGILVDRLGKVIGPNYMLPRRAVEALRLAWGPGSRIPPDDQTEEWSADTTHAALKQINESSDSWILQLNSYEPLRSWLGAGPTVAAIPAAIWSGPLSQVGGAHPELAIDVKGMTIMLPSSEWSPAEGTQATLHLDDQKVPSQISMLLAYPNTKIREQMLEAFEEKWGKAVAKNHRWTFEQTPNVELKDVDSGWSLTVTRASS